MEMNPPEPGPVNAFLSLAFAFMLFACKVLPGLAGRFPGPGWLKKGGLTGAERIRFFKR
jgi:hypothetical protein